MIPNSDQVYETPKILGSGDSCVVVEFSDAIDMEANIRLQDLRRIMETWSVPGIRECVPTYRSLSVYYNPLKITRPKLEETIRRALESIGRRAERERRTLVIPVSYGGEFGPDMESVSNHTGLPEDEIIRRHTNADYYCYMLGFTPGFGYLGGMDESLATPRLRNPRLIIPAGSVGIAGNQTGVYSVDSPGGWRLIGRTPLKLFDPGDDANPTLMEAGEWVRFRGISPGEYASILEDVHSGRYIPERSAEAG
ncbi:MAG: 5-oxoprolinase subunit PxpB [Synergistaceae bacterium]|nr:5-oxoprolinase subunit PxpB [Synergistaceae bacterium]